MSSASIRHAAPAAQLTAQVTTAQIFALASNAQLPATIGVPGKGTLEGKQFKIRAEGSAYVAAAATTIKANLLGALTVPASPFVIGNWTNLGAGTARAVAAAGYVPWWIEASVMYDSNGGLLQGVFEQMVNNLFDARAALANTIAGINGTNVTVTQGATPIPPADPVAVFAVALTFSAAGANLGNLANFEIGF
jgi:hypothetical protein